LTPASISNHADETSHEQADREIAGCISDIGIHFSIENLQKPNQQQIQKVFEWFAELLMNATRDTVAPAMRAAAEDMCGGEAERLFGGDTRDLMGFFVVLRRLVGEVSWTFSLRYSTPSGVCSLRERE